MPIEASISYEFSDDFIRLPSADDRGDQSRWALEAAQRASSRAVRPLSPHELGQLIGLLSGHAEVHRSRGHSTAGYAVVLDPEVGVDAYLQIKQAHWGRSGVGAQALRTLDINGTPLIGDYVIEEVLLASGAAVHHFSRRQSSFNMLSGVVRSEQYFVMPPERPDLFVMFHAEWMDPYMDEEMPRFLRFMADSMRIDDDQSVIDAAVTAVHVPKRSWWKRT